MSEPKPARERLAEGLLGARKKLGLTQEEVAARVGLTRQAVNEIENAKRGISAFELHALAKLYGEPMERLLGVEEETEEERVLLRAVEVAPEARAALHRFVERCREYHELEEWCGEPGKSELRPPTQPISSFAEAEALARDERQRLGLGEAPARELSRVLEEKVGVKVFCEPLGAGVAGASIRGRFGPAILVNNADFPARRNWTLAHEYFHLLTFGLVPNSRGPEPVSVCEAGATGTGKDRAEVLADIFTAEFLVPREALHERLRPLLSEKRVSKEDLVRLADYFGVSAQALLWRLKTVYGLKRAAVTSLHEDPEFLYLARTLRTDYETEPPQGSARFAALAIKAARKGEISRSRLAELLGVNVASVGKLLKTFEEEPGDVEVERADSR
jgi:Zn-dependent peptidase ImmA (M78 family)/DNA-binding XRE family transcriptional regulator